MVIDASSKYAVYASWVTVCVFLFLSSVGTAWLTIFLLSGHYGQDAYHHVGVGRLLAFALSFILSKPIAFTLHKRCCNTDEEIAERMRMSRLFVGTLMLAFATSLPEVVTDITAAREALHAGTAQWALRKVRPDRASRSRFGVWATGGPPPRGPTQSLRSSMTSRRTCGGSLPSSWAANGPARLERSHPTRPR